jgi:hypothetical protein
MMTTNEQQKKKWLDAIYKDYPALKNDTLKHHFINEMIESFLADEKKFKAEAYKAKKENAEIFKEAPTEVVAISKIEDVEEKKPQVTVTFDEDIEEDNKNQ